MMLKNVDNAIELYKYFSTLHILLFYCFKRVELNMKMMMNKMTTTTKGVEPTRHFLLTTVNMNRCTTIPLNSFHNDITRIITFLEKKVYVIFNRKCVFIPICIYNFAH